VDVDLEKEPCVPLTGQQMPVCGRVQDDIGDLLAIHTLPVHKQRNFRHTVLQNPMHGRYNPRPLASGNTGGRTTNHSLPIHKHKVPMPTCQCYLLVVQRFGAGRLDFEEACWRAWPDPLLNAELVM
jgi:hypothetical protein